MISIRVCSMGTIEAHEEFGAQYMVSLLAHPFDAAELRPPWIDPARHHVFWFADLEDANLPEAPTREDIRRVVALGKELAGPGSEAAFLIHCAAGVSRSPAAAFIFFTIHLGPGSESDALHRTAQSAESPAVWPNALMIRYADDLLGRQGAMIRALAEWEGRQFTVP